MKDNSEQKMSHFPLRLMIAAVLLSICFNAYAQGLMQFDIEAKSPDSEKQTIAATKVESVFSLLLASETNPERVKGLKLAHRDWLTLRRSHCSGLTKDNKNLIECYEAFDNQRIEIYNNQRISLLYDVPPRATLPTNTIKISFSGEQKLRPSTPHSIVASADAPIAAVEFENDTTEIFDLVNGQRINRIKTKYIKNKGFGDQFFLIPNGRILIWSVYAPRTEQAMWDVRTGELLRHKTLPQYKQLPMSGGRYFIYIDKNGIGIYDVIMEKVIWNAEKGKDRISLMATSPDDKHLVVARGHDLESWELAKAADGKPSFVMRATAPVANLTYIPPSSIAFANDNNSFYITYSIPPPGSIIQRRLPDLKEMRHLQFPKLQYARLEQIKNTDILLMQAAFSDSRRGAFYVDMARETAQKIVEYTGTNSRMAPLANGQVALATPYELKILNVPPKNGFAKFSDIIGEVISKDTSIDTATKETDKRIVTAQMNCQNFQVEAIGVYEGSLPDNRTRGRGEKIAGYVDVNIGHTDLPVKLVLSSYEPVTWRLNISSDARLSEICLSGSNDSRVEGIQDITVSYIGNAYAYKDANISSSRHGGNHMSSLAELVKQKTGCSITKFQGVYKGSHFYVGYITKDSSEKKGNIYKYVDENGNVIYRNY